MITRGVIAHGLITHGLITHGVIAHGVIAHGVIAHGVIAHGVIAHGVIAHGLIAHGLIACEVAGRSEKSRVGSRERTTRLSSYELAPRERTRLMVVVEVVVEVVVVLDLLPLGLFRLDLAPPLAQEIERPLLQPT